ncbi:hypothetical protein GALMADRAFT_140956 [Galerina marginata CBS 339.88]|uniref:Uncharacterized protein n=1 Tax=Galerina marginata (strain CBS 339.88) TaxID=685588 RepID=A0A067SX64_GALM3|nr:hypothetical protein GALMADRAFT_140956 [Galerina marginata CBS 339.88]
MDRLQDLGRDFLQLRKLGKKVVTITLDIRKGGPWIRKAGGDNTSFARLCRCILNHAPIGSYYRRFNIQEPHGCPRCGAPRETRSHILSYCPGDVKQWIQRARSPTWRPIIQDLAKFEREFGAWWTALQPEWRVEAEEGHAVEDGEGDWEVLRKQGLNGLLSLLAALFFWGLHIRDSAVDRARWTTVVDDCFAAVTQVVQIAEPEPIRFFRILLTASFVRQAFARGDGPPNRRVPRERRPPSLRQYHLRANPKAAQRSPDSHSCCTLSAFQTRRPLPNPNPTQEPSCHPNFDDPRPDQLEEKAEWGDKAPNWSYVDDRPSQKCR